mgnify:FL=1
MKRLLITFLQHMKSSFVKKPATYVKAKSRIFRIVGGLAVAVSALARLLGLSDGDTVYIFATLGVVLTIIPNIAEQVVPNPKPISHMTSDEIFQFIIGAHPKNDWGEVINDSVEERYLKKDPKLRFRVAFNQDGMHNENFQEVWANRHSDQRAVSYWYDLFYSGVLIQRTILVAVDGGRASIPMPDLKSKKIKTYEYKVAEIHDSLDSLNKYIQRSGLEVEGNHIN